MGVVVTTTIEEVKTLDYQPYGSARDILVRRWDEKILSGPAGSGKSRACLESIHAILEKYDGARALMVRKTRASLTNTGIVTYEKLVCPPGATRWNTTDQCYEYRNGSILAVGGMDNSMKIMSSEYDMIYVQEATELSEGDWEDLTTRLRWGHVPYQEIWADCNPGPPTHWLKRRANSGKLLMLESRHEDNPVLWDRVRQAWTAAGEKYIRKLDNLSGVRYLRLRKGVWAASEGMVYSDWDPQIHLIDSFRDKDGNVIPPDPSWARIWAVDFGYTNPFVFQAWVIDPDGRLILYKEIYRTQRIVADHARDILALMQGDPWPIAIICDHDAEDRATLERGLGLPTIPAYKAVGPGIQAVQRRLRKAGDGRPRFMIMRDCCEERDELLLDSKLPSCTAEEIEGYVWPARKTSGKTDETKPMAESPVKKNDHGCDAFRYLCAAVDHVADDPYQQEVIGSIGDIESISPI